MEKSKTKVFVLVNTLQSVASTVYSNHITFFAYTAKKHPEIEFYFFTPHRMSIDNARNSAASMALHAECDYLMFLDDDVMIPQDTLPRLIKANKDIVAGDVIIRGYPFHSMFFKFTRGKVKTLAHVDELPAKKGLIKVDAVGFSCCLIKCELLKKINPPYFVTGTGHTEDVYFCMAAYDQLGSKNVSIYVDTSIECGHILNAEPLQRSIVKKMRKFYQDTFEEGEKAPVGRGPDYIRRNLRKLGK